MLTSLRDRSYQYNLLTASVALIVLIVAFYLGQRASVRWLGLLIAGLGALVLLARPALGLFALVAAALVMRLEFGTGTDVTVNPVTLLVPAVGIVWLLDQVRRGRIRVIASSVNLPLALFLGASLLSLLIGRAFWNPMVLVGGSFILVQMAQWAIFAFSALAFWLMANLVTDQKTLWRLTVFFLLLGGGVAILRAMPGLDRLVGRFTTLAFIRAPFWVLLVALAGGQLLWNRQLSPSWRIFLGAALLAALIYALVEQQEAVSNWVGIGAVLGMLFWLRFPRMRWPLVILVLFVTIAGVLFPTLYDFAGGDDEWIESGGSRLVLIERVVDVTMRNPVTGLGPAAYRSYASMTPLAYGRALWVVPAINSHNNYVDIFAQTGLVGLGLFLWFMAAVARLGWRLRSRFQQGFVAGYVNGMLGAWAGVMVVMLFLDWFLPFVYNVQFVGFQASVLVWLFLGGLVAIENWGGGEEGEEGKEGNDGKAQKQEPIRLIEERISDG